MFGLILNDDGKNHQRLNRELGAQNAISETSFKINFQTKKMTFSLSLNK